MKYFFHFSENKLDHFSLFCQYVFAGSFLLLLVNEYRVATSAYTFQGEQTKIWVDKLKKAQILYGEHLDKANSGLGEIEIIYDDIEDEGLAFPSSALLNIPMQMKPSVSHEDLPSRLSCSESDFSPVLNISRAKSTECLFVRPSSATPCDSRQHSVSPSPSAEKRSDFPPKSHSFNRTITDEMAGGACGDEPQRSEIVLQVPRRGSGSKESHLLLSVPGDTGSWDSRKKVLTIQRKDLVSRSVSVPAGGADMSTQSGSDPSSPSRASPVDGRLLAGGADDSEMATRGSKLNQRRLVRSERRYHTADGIELIDRDPSIHKRLSWNLGNGQADAVANSQAARLKATSADSLRSGFSSSGFSSSGSLHMSPEYESIDENTAVASSDSVESVNSDPFAPGKPIQLTITLPDRLRERPLSTVSLQPPSLSLDSAEAISGKHQRSKTLPHGRDHSKSRSLSDLSTSDVKDGVASVTFTLRTDRQQQMSPTQLLRLKKQLLLNTDVQAS